MSASFNPMAFYRAAMIYWFCDLVLQVIHVSLQLHIDTSSVWQGMIAALVVNSVHTKWKWDRKCLGHKRAKCEHIALLWLSWRNDIRRCVSLVHRWQPIAEVLQSHMLVGQWKVPGKSANRWNQESRYVVRCQYVAISQL